MSTHKLCDILVAGVPFLLFMLAACSENAAPTAAGDPTETLSKNSVVHHASLGGADICEALGLATGCDANFSLVGNEMVDGSVSGQWQDTFPGGKEGIHVAVDCLNFVDNFAIIGGAITNGTAGGVDVSGQRAVTAVVDNGTSTSDPADQLSFSFIGAIATQLLGSTDCNALTPANFQGFLNNLTNGQVTVY